MQMYVLFYNILLQESLNVQEEYKNAFSAVQSLFVVLKIQNDRCALRSVTFKLVLFCVEQVVSQL